MKGRGASKLGAPSADLLVCFPSRAHLTLMPKPVCSPARLSDQATKRFSQHHLKRLNTKGAAGHANASPLMWAKTKPREQITEPTSPKVTCAGQIKVRPKAGSCKSWRSVMEEIERIHNKRIEQKSKRPSWAESFGFKKDVMQFLTCLRNIRFDFRCFGAFPHADITTTDDEEDEAEDELDQFDQENGNHLGDVIDQTSSKTVFSKWFMVLQENQNKDKAKPPSVVVDDDDESSVAAPPPNALLLMRCRSAPAKSRFQDKAEDEEKENKEMSEEEKHMIQMKKTKNLRSLMEEEQTNNKENLVLNMGYEYDTDFYKISSDIAKETWIDDGMKDLLSRSRSWKR